MDVATALMPSRVHDPYAASAANMQFPQYHDPRSQHRLQGANTESSTGYAAGHHHDYTQEHTLYSNTPAHAPTPPEDQHRTSLPSISNLLGIADGEKTSQPVAESRSLPQQEVHSQQDVHQIQHHHQIVDFAAAPPQPQPMSDYTYRPSAPPTPPMRAETNNDVVQSPSTISSHSSFSAPAPAYTLGSTMHHVDASHQRAHLPLTIPKPVPSHQMVYTTSPLVGPGYIPSPTSISPGYYSPDMMYPTNGMYHQRPLPSNFPPTMMGAPMAPPGFLPTANPWEHHHYLSAAHAAFPSVQDRYICPTCKKAFSRPSSLKIHSHSHTGEKPFKCPHPGCGKAFSVRSNMKRHERGCHSMDGSFSS